MTAEDRVELRFEGGETAPRRARHAIRERLGEKLDAETAYDVHVVVSELVANSVRHGGVNSEGSITVALMDMGDRLRIEVEDPGPGFDPPENPQPRPEGGGRGLVLLERMTSRWGVERNERTRVWFEVDCDGH